MVETGVATGRTRELVLVQDDHGIEAVAELRLARLTAVRDETERAFVPGDRAPYVGDD